MQLLAIDTSGPVCGVAVAAGGSIRYSCAVTNKRTHSVNLLPMLDAALAGAGLTLAELDAIACVVGPGSFTGVRLGVSTVKGLAHGAGRPCIPVNALEALAAGVGDFDGVICPIQDARAGQVYGAAFRAGAPRPERLMADEPIKLEDYAERIAALGSRFLFLGDGMPVHRERLMELLGARAVFAPPALAYLNPGAAAQVAMFTEERLDYLSLQPLYLRAPSAERNRKLMEAQHG